jgi:16S rRNA C967 or C1407 C5-methylase (RsmB/RsmF family)
MSEVVALERLRQKLTRLFKNTTRCGICYCSFTNNKASKVLSTEALLTLHYIFANEQCDLQELCLFNMGVLD